MMNILKVIRILIWVFLVFALLIIASFFLPQNIYIERSAHIEASPQIVFNQINDLHNWDKWSKWNMIDPQMKINYIHNGVGEGAGYEWSSENKKVGKGSIFVMEAVKYDSIVVKIKFMNEGEARSRFKLIRLDNGTQVFWNLSNDVGYNPFARWMGLLMDKFVGPDFEEGLTNLKTVCKIQQEENSYQPELTILKEFNYISLRQEVENSAISLRMEEMYGTISNYIQKNEIEISGMPFSVYHSMNAEKIDLECGIPVNNLVECEEPFKSGTFNNIKCATLDYFGDYNNLESGHSALQKWIEERRFKLAGSPIEIYVTNPGQEQNPENWLTKIYYPVF